MNRIKMCLVTTVSLTMEQFFLHSLETMYNEGFDITLASNMDEKFIQKCPRFVSKVPIRMKRGADLFGSLRALFQLIKLFSRERFDIVEYATPNASLYTSIAAWLTRIPVRISHHCGFIYIMYKGWKRFLLKTVERLVCALSTDVQPVSRSNLHFMQAEGICSSKKSRVVWNGSSSGVNLSKFDISRKQEYGALIRQKYGMKSGDFVVGFTGRIGKEKGFNELISAFKEFKSRHPESWLLFTGNSEKPETVDPELLSWFNNDDRVIITGYVDDTEKYYSAMDVFVFPSYHEGFGNVIIEAEAMGLPIIASDIPGPRDGAIENETAIFVPVKTVDPIVEAMERLYKDPSLREKMGLQGRAFVERSFDSRILTGKMIENKKWLIDTRMNKPAKVLT